MVIDFHSHILPGIDDGSKSTEESLEMLQMMADQGIRQVIATPHFYGKHDNLQSFLERRADAKARLDEAIGCLSGNLQPLPEIKLGAEVAYFRGMSQSKQLSDLAIEGTSAILVEMPMTKWTDVMYRELLDIYQTQRLIPIVAHVDRYLTPFRSFGIPEKLAQLPVYVQANAEFFTDKKMSRKGLKMLQKGQIHFLGSDTHNLRNRKPNLGDAITVIEGSLGDEVLAQIEAWQNEIF